LCSRGSHGVSLVASGGQTGVDRAALDTAIRLGIPYGGWCPAGGWAEDLGSPPGLLDRYPRLRSTPSADPAQRTEWNVRDCDATLVLFPDGVDSPGTLLPEAFARRMERPCTRLDPRDPGAPSAATAFVSRHCLGGSLNVAGPRESGSPGVYDASRRLLRAVLVDVSAAQPPEDG